MGSLRGCRLPGECPIYARVWQSWRETEKGEGAKKVRMLVFNPPNLNVWVGAGTCPPPPELPHFSNALKFGVSQLGRVLCPQEQDGDRGVTSLGTQHLSQSCSRGAGGAQCCSGSHVPLSLVPPPVTRSRQRWIGAAVSRRAEPCRAVLPSSPL